MASADRGGAHRLVAARDRARSHLFDWAIDEARQRGCTLIQLTTNAQRPDALAFYESLGFSVTHQGLKMYLQGDVTGR